MKKNLYRWHRILSMIIALPLVLWAGSGFMHPLMTSIRPQVATQNLPPEAIDPAKLNVGLQEALQKNGIGSVQNFRLIRIAGNWFYQVKTARQIEPVYLSADKGRRLPNGDAVYASYLAREFLTGKKPAVKSAAPDQNPLQADCCAAATEAALGISGDVRILGTKALTQFTPEYKPVNRLLPVRSVWFDRDDDLRIYVETLHDRFALAVDKNREGFDRWFGWFHTWTWMDAFGRVQVILMSLVMLGIFATSVLGLYLFFTTKSKKSAHKVVRSRRWHRYTALSISLFTLLFSLSGFLHIAAKWTPDDREKYVATDLFSGKSLDPDFAALLKKVPENSSAGQISPVRMGGRDLWRIELFSPVENSSGNSSAMADKKTEAPQAIYIDCRSGRTILQGENSYARELALRLSGFPEKDITAVQAVTHFGEAYNFADKRLPVWEVDFRNGERWFVETSSGHLASRVTKAGLLEGYSFALLHKHHFMDWGGKTLRDVSTLFWAGAQIFMVIFGLVLFFRIRKQKQKNTTTKSLNR